MMYLKLKKKIVLILAIFLSFLLFSAQSLHKPQDSLTEEQFKRIDPRLHGLLTEQIPSLKKPGIVTAVNPSSIQPDGLEIYSAVIYTDSPVSLRNDGIRVNSVLPDFVTSRFNAAELVRIARNDAVKYVDAGEIYYPTNDVAAGAVGSDLVKGGYVNNTEYKGSGVIVCIIDSGIDWEHEDFRDPLDPTQSRILYVWDMTLTASGEETTPEDRDGVNYAGLDYGVEYSNIQIEDEIDGSPVGFVRESDTNGHGTHVAGTAAGNGASLSTRKYEGMAPDADLLIIKAGNGSFLTNYLIDALTYAKQVASDAGKAIVVNMSLGGHANAHDGTRSLDVAVDDFTGTGRVAVISAGNEGNDYIHITGTVSNSATANIQFVVNFYTANGGTDNDYVGFDLWWNDAGNVTATVTSPNSYSYQRTAGQSGTSETNDGSIYLYNNTDASHSNGDRRNYIYIYDNNASYPPAQGTWTLAVQNNSGFSMTYHGWLFTKSMSVDLTSGDTDNTVGSPGTANEAITVGSYVSKWRWMNTSGGTYWGGYQGASDDISAFSSIGPRRDGVQKPDIAAPGDKIASSLSQHSSRDAAYILPGDQHTVMQGTSMSSPVTAGSIALLLEANSNLTASEIKDLITSTAMSDSYTGVSLPDYTWGYGKLDIFRAMAKLLDSGTGIDREILNYDSWSASDIQVQINQDDKIAVKFTPTISCKVTGLFIHPSSTVSLTGPLSCEVWSDNGSGLPGTKLGSTVTFDQDKIAKFGWNFIEMTNADVTVTAETNYHAIVYYSSGSNLYMLIDDGSIDSRSSYNIGSGWQLYGGGDFRIRPVISSEEGLLLAADIFLEGAYDDVGDEMTTSLNLSYIPTTSPYSEDARTVSSIPSDITDWVLVQIRSSKTGAAVASMSAFLHKNGSIVADNGYTNQIVLEADPGNYYIVVDHRNHLTVMSDETVYLSAGSTASYDFTTGTDKYEGADAALLETGVYGMYAGDGNESGIVTISDANLAITNRDAVGYEMSDYNLSGIVTISDANQAITNRDAHTNVQ